MYQFAVNFFALNTWLVKELRLTADAIAMIPNEYFFINKLLSVSEVLPTLFFRFSAAPVLLQ